MENFSKQTKTKFQPQNPSRNPLRNFLYLFMNQLALNSRHTWAHI